MQTDECDSSHCDQILSPSGASADRDNVSKLREMVAIERDADLALSITA